MQLQYTIRFLIAHSAISFSFAGLLSMLTTVGVAFYYVYMHNKRKKAIDALYAELHPKEVNSLKEDAPKAEQA